MSARRRSQKQSATKKTAPHREVSSDPSQAVSPPMATPAEGRPAARATTRSAPTTTSGSQHRRQTGQNGDQPEQAKAMGLPVVPIPSRPQRQSKVDALAKKVWTAIAPGAGRKRANPANQSASEVPTKDKLEEPNDTQGPVSKKRKGAVKVQTVGGPTKATQGQPAAVRTQSENTRTPVNSTGSVPRPQASARQNIKAIPRVELSVDSDSAVESEDDVPLQVVQRATANHVNISAKASMPVEASLDKREPDGGKPFTRGVRTAAQAKATLFKSTEAADQAADVDVAESDASNSADEYAPEDDDDAFSEEDELDDPLSEDLEELEAQLREEAPVWTKEKDAALPPVLRRKQNQKRSELLIQLEKEEQQQSAGKAERSTSKASQRQQLEQPTWKPAADPTPSINFEDDFEPWGPVKYSIPSLEDGPWEENGRVPAGDESDAHSDDSGTNFHPQVYEIKPPVTPGGVLSLKEQHEHIQDMIRLTFTHVESNLVFTNGFPDAVGRARFVYDAMRDSAQELGYRGLYRRLGQDASFARSLASLPNQRISTFRSHVKKHTDSAAIAFYGLQPGLAADKVEWLFDHLKYIYPVVHEPVDKRNATWAKPYQNPAVTSTLRTCFFTGPTAVGNRDEARFVSSRPDREDEREIPMPMLALVGAALHASLSEWRTGAHRKGTFSADAFLDAYTEHVTLLTGIKNQNPRAYHTMMHRLYTEASGIIAPTATLSNASDALAHVDFAGMDVD